MFLWVLDVGECVHRRGGTRGKGNMLMIEPSGFGGAGREGTARERSATRCLGARDGGSLWAGALGQSEVRPIKAPVSSR